MSCALIDPLTRQTEQINTEARMTPTERLTIDLIRREMEIDERERRMKRKYAMTLVLFFAITVFAYLLGGK